MNGIFISYRQADAKAWAIGLRDDLAGVFGEDRVFLDKDTLHAGNWREQIQEALGRCKVVLVVIGPRWLTVSDEQNRPRIQLTDDVHHQEVAFVLSRSDVTVIPVLVDEARMPRADQLPQDLRKLPDQQARSIGDTQARRKADLAVLVEDIRAVGGIQPRAHSTPKDESGTDTSRSRIGWLRLDLRILGIAFALTLLAGIYAYLVNWQFNAQEVLFLFVVIYGLALGVRWLRTRTRREGGRHE
jgi:hypothetical protein